MKKLYYGAAYYPELWPEKAIIEDIRYMKEAGINVIRIGEFAWAKMEPKENEIDLSFFVRMIERFYNEGIETIFCTPTPTPPIWLSHGHPERMHVDGSGATMVHGARQHMCTNNKYFRERSSKIVKAIAEAIGRLPGVIGWQTDNEFKCHVSECMCESCKAQWHEWLLDRYGIIDNLNEAWGTEIWSEKYQLFDQVPQPFKAPFHHNASLTTMYQRFTQEKIAEFQNEQINIIRQYSDAPITHNSNIWFALDNELLFKNLDFASFDDYPDCDNYELMLHQYDLFRNIKKGRPFWVMETSTSHNGNLSGYQKTHRNGYLEAEAVAAYAFGAEGFNHWLWRQQRSGCELPHGAVLSAWGKPTVGYKNVLAVSEARKRLEPILLSTTICQAEVAMTYSDRARVFFLTEPLENLEYRTMAYHWYKEVLGTGIYRDWIHEGHELKGYKILITPFVPYLSDSYIDIALQFVEEGGVWIVGPLTGGRTEEHTVHTGAGLGRLDTLAGVETVYTYPMSGSDAVGHAFGLSASLGLWSSVFETNGARVMGTIEGGVTPGMAFLTEHQHGNGKIVMLGSMPQGEEGSLMIQELVRHYAKETGIRHWFDTSYGTVVAPRRGGSGEEVWIAINMDGNGGWVSLPSEAMDMLTGEQLNAGKLKIQPYAYQVIQFTSGNESN
ncbi:beta-galactosidase [Paenibacillus castaneae]|uniref:beta-galactosidase n=1 Tax=Paenibacillus castaneae TaxID=474957 RepID=UPI000C9A7E79|nr:beta-galactosidase [Paenibacillus castaneae]NIK78069.1 beta-galactosidase [Paenibacillus castaneae]